MQKTIKLEANELKWIELCSQAESISDIDQRKLDALLQEHFEKKSFVVLWLDDRVLIGTFEYGAFHFYDRDPFKLKHVQRLRVFDLYKELLLWRTNSSLKGRLRKDDDLQGEKTDVIVAEQALFGTRSKTLNERFTKITEQRGTELILPFTNLKVDEKRNRVCIQTYNYVMANIVHQATYFDCRFVKFTNNGTELT